MKRLDGAVRRIAPNGVVIGANQRITVEEAVNAFCVGGAYTSHEENRKGRIVAGQLADLVVLGEDPTTVDVAKLKDVPIDITVVGGKVVWQAADHQVSVAGPIPK